MKPHRRLGSGVCLQLSNALVLHGAALSSQPDRSRHRRGRVLIEATVLSTHLSEPSHATPAKHLIRIADGPGSANPHLTNLRSAHTSPASASSPNFLNLASANPCYSNIESWQLLPSSTQVRLAFVSSSVILYLMLYLLTSPYPSGCRLGLPYVRRCPTYGNHRATAPPSSSFSIRLDRSAALHVPRLPVVDFEGAYAPLRPSAVT